MAFVLVSSLGILPKHVRVPARRLLIDSAEDTALDNPAIVKDLAMFSQYSV